jgi:hypothetical protein
VTVENSEAAMDEMEVTREIDETDDFESDVEDNILIVKNC